MLATFEKKKKKMRKLHKCPLKKCASISFTNLGANLLHRLIFVHHSNIKGTIKLISSLPSVAGPVASIVTLIM